MTSLVSHSSPFERVQRAPEQPGVVRMTPAEHPEAEHPEDRALLQAALAGDPAAVEALVQRLRCIPRVLVVLNQRMGQALRPADLNDLAQDTLTNLWERLESYTGQASLETWAYGFCFNGYMNLLRKLRRRRAHDGLEGRDLASPEPSPTGSLDFEGLHRCLAQLEPREGSVIRLKYFDELTFEEIGARLGISPNTAKTCFYRGMRRLEALLRERKGGGGS